MTWNRRQLPVRPAFTMTIDKSHGQTLKQVGVWLEGGTNIHHAWTAVCRGLKAWKPITSSLCSTTLIMETHINITRENMNFVYKEIL